MMRMTLIAILTILLFSGCAEKIVYKDKIIKVKVPVKCETPVVKCKLKKGANLVERLAELLGCVELYKEANKVCSNTKTN